MPLPLRLRGTRSVAAVTAAVLIVLAALVAGTGSQAHAAEVARFDPGYIISDAALYASGSMTTEQVESFLDSRGSACRPSSTGVPCLKDYEQDTTTRVADTRCGKTYDGATRETAAQIVTKVAVACGISPKVLLVMLQKEQGLVTASGASLTPTRYRSAMGYGCPDTAACDSRYYGFFNQVYQAAWQLRSYALTPTRWAHRAGVVNQVRYHPSSACGSSPVLIENQATASLYNYTPYQPNAAALAAGSGSGDACSAYGNRNFFNFYTAWFGAPNARSPIGAVDTVASTDGGVAVGGWALDPDTTGPTEVHVYIDGSGYAVTADLSRPDVDRAHGLGDRHGFAATLPAGPGRHTVCAYALNVGGGNNTLLGCRTVTVPNRAPIGAVDSVTAAGTTVTVSGWSLDPDTDDPNAVHLYVDGRGAAVVADRSRPDVAAAHGRGDRHGFAYTTTLPPGPHRVCAYGIDTLAGPHSLLACRTVTVEPGRAPIGNLESVTVTGAQATVTGWALDPDTSAPIPVHVYVDGVGAPVLAGASRPDVAAAHGLGAEHGFTHTRTLTPGRHLICVYGINDAPGPNTTLGCVTATTT